MRYDRDLSRQVGVATEIVAAAFAVHALVTELRKGRRMQAGQAALRAVAAVVGIVIAIRDAQYLEEEA